MTSDSRGSTLIEKRIRVGFLLATLIAVVIGLITYRSNQQSIEAGNWAKSSQAELRNIEEIGSLLTDIETGSRGYVLTGDTAFLQPLNNATAILPDKFSRLMLENAEHPSALVKIDSLKESARLKIQWAELMADTRANRGFQDAAKMVSSKIGKDLMDRVRRQVKALLEEEQDVLTKRLEDEKSRSAQSTLLTFIGMGFQLSVLLFVFAAISRDLTGRKQAETELRRVGAYTRSLIEASLDPLVTISSKGTITDVNQATIQATGVSREQLIGSDFSNYFTEPVKAREGYERVLSEGFVRDYPLSIRHVSGNTLEVIYNASVYRDGNNNVVGVFAAARDISGLRRAEANVRESEEKFRTIFENSVTGKSITGIDGSMQVNKSFCRMVGYSPEELKSTPWKEITHPDDIRESEEIVASLVRGDRTEARFEKRYLRKDGMVVWTDVSTTLHRDPGGTPVFFITSVSDISHRKLSEIALRESEENIRFQQERLSLALKAGQSGTFDWDIEHNVNTWSREIEELYGVPAGHFGKTFEAWELLVYPEDLESARDIAAKALKTGELDGEWRIQRKSDGQIRSLAARGKVLFDDRGKPVRMMGINWDITDKKRSEEVLKRTLLDLQRSNKELEQFAYVASHDLQEPLRMVSSFVQLLEQRYKDRLDQDAHEFIEFAVDGASRMQKLINDLLTFSRVGTRGRDFTTVNCEQVFSDILENLRQTIDDSKAVITHDPLPVILADETQILQLFQNLVGNALKFHREGQHPIIHVSASEQDGEYLFSVRDHGIGIETEFFNRIFIIFQRLHQKDKYQGTGIGLALCKKIIERHSGRIWVDSTPGRGSTFYFAIPKERERII